MWLPVCRTDLRKGMSGLALQVQQVLVPWDTISPLGRMAPNCGDWVDANAIGPGTLHPFKVDINTEEKEIPARAKL